MRPIGHCDACQLVVAELDDATPCDGVQLPLPGFGRTCPRCLRWLRVVYVSPVASPHACGKRCKTAACNICRCACMGRAHGVERNAYARHAALVRMFAGVVDSAESSPTLDAVDSDSCIAYALARHS